jgi:hypothetical protein
MERSLRSAQLVTLAAAVFMVLVVQIALAGTGDGPRATASASLAKQVKKLKGQVAGLEARLAAVEAKPAATIPTIPSSLPPSGPAGGELTGAYPSPTIGTVSGLDLASSSDPTAGINFGTDVALHRALFTIGPFPVGLFSTANFSVAGELSTGSFLNLSTTTVAPTTGCAAVATTGRMIFNTTDNKLYICGAGAWKSIQAL